MSEAVSKYIVFKLGNVDYGVTVQQVRSIERLQEMTQVPRTSKFVKGVINLRGDVTPIIDLKERLGMPETKYTDQTRILIVPMEQFQVGFIVDAATDVIDIDPSIIEAPERLIVDVEPTFLSGVAKLKEKLLILLNMENVLSIDEMAELNEIVVEE